MCSKLSFPPRREPGFEATARPYIAIGQGGQLPPPRESKVMITSELTLHVYSKMLIVCNILNNTHCHVTVSCTCSCLHVETMETASSYSSENDDDDDGEPVPKRLCQSSLCAFILQRGE